ncbi:SDR family NAD(P)-dependent oxidoreductase [Acetobacteraceae bacterium KSS8]|uniref:SDR family NAD(P)-dependent oxidoreductase n=1 Tax=Endosaccharibacter trunci TaxID=2812733 RepID=A0ABT1W6L7_9PROT|nr:SDR family NAD(P)-dependent oxidoreductase [Acetobacteraceae bacterium KSS8]
MLDPKSRVVMLSGASRGIGAAVCDRLLASGFLVSAGVRNPSALADRAGLFATRYDATVQGAAEDWVETTMTRFGRVEALVNVAGMLPNYTLHDADETQLDRALEINVKAPLRLIRAAMPHLKACGDGRIVNVSSLSGKRVANDDVGYAMSKFAVTALTHAARRDGWDSGVRATVVCPGFVATDMTSHVRTVPPEKMTQPEDLAVLIETVLLLPQTAVVAELLVNCRLETVI